MRADRTRAGHGRRDARFLRQRAKVIRPAQPSVRALRRSMRRRRPELKPIARAFRGIVATPEREALVKVTASLHRRHNDIMDPFRFPERRHPQARRSERAVRRAAEDIGWKVATVDGQLLFLR